MSQQDQEQKELVRQEDIIYPIYNTVITIITIPITIICMINNSSKDQCNQYYNQWFYYNIVVQFIHAITSWVVRQYPIFMTPDSDYRQAVNIINFSIFANYVYSFFAYVFTGCNNDDVANTATILYYLFWSRAFAWFVCVVLQIILLFVVIPCIYCCPNGCKRCITRVLRRFHNHESVLNRQQSVVNIFLSKIDAIPVIKYDITNKKHTEFHQCTICSDNFVNGCDVKILPCGHIFHKDCNANGEGIDKWLKKHWTCPNCRYNVITDVGEGNYNDSSDSPTAG